MIIIGEKLHATLPGIVTIIEKRDAGALLKIAGKQASAGADFIDVNVGTGFGAQIDEIVSMQWAVETIQAELEVPLCIDSSDVEVLEAGLRVRNGRLTLLNSATADVYKLEEVARLARQYHMPFIGLAMDASGVPQTVDGRLRACETIAAVCTKHKVGLETVYFDPLVLPVGTDTRQAVIALTTLAEIKKRFPEARTVMGLSNVSYGLPARVKLDVAFLQMAVYVGLDAVIMDPLDEDLMGGVKTAELLMGKDRGCGCYMEFFGK